MSFPSRARVVSPNTTPPLRGSRQDEGASPKSRRWGEYRRFLRSCHIRGGATASCPHRSSWRLAV